MEEDNQKLLEEAEKELEKIEKQLIRLHRKGNEKYNQIEELKENLK